MTKIGSRLLSAVAISVTILGAHPAWASNFVMSGYQQLPTNSAFTEIVSVFPVPTNPPNFSAPFSLWPGLESASYLVQPVLMWRDACNGNDNGPCPQWTMQNEVEPGSLFGRQVAVNPGDVILAAVWLDNNNPGSNCEPLSGVNCNYLVGWEDLNTGASDTGLSQANMTDFMFPDSPYIAYGLMLETGSGVPQTYNDCTDFPFQTGIQAETELFQATSWSALFNPVPTDLFLGMPGLNSSYTDQPLTNGGTVFGSCGFQIGVGAQSTDIGLIQMGF